MALRGQPQGAKSGPSAMRRSQHHSSDRTPEVVAVASIACGVRRAASTDLAGRRFFSVDRERCAVLDGLEHEARPDVLDAGEPRRQWNIAVPSRRAPNLGMKRRRNQYSLSSAAFRGLKETSDMTIMI